MEVNPKKLRPDSNKTARISGRNSECSDLKFLFEKLKKTVKKSFCLISTLGKLHSTSFCNIHSVWKNEIKKNEKKNVFFFLILFQFSNRIFQFTCQHPSLG